MKGGREDGRGVTELRSLHVVANDLQISMFFLALCSGTPESALCVCRIEALVKIFAHILEDP